MSSDTTLWWILTAVAGSCISHWRYVAGEGFGLGRANAPAILASPGGYLLVLLIGAFLRWGAAAALLVINGPVVALFALALGFVVSRVLLRIFCAHEIRSAAELLGALQGRQSDR